MSHTRLCRKLQHLLTRVCPHIHFYFDAEPTITFSGPVIKTEEDDIQAELDAIVRCLRNPDEEETSMNETTINNTQKTLMNVALNVLNPDGTLGGEIVVTGLVINVTSGDGTFSNIANDGTQLPNNQAFLISGANSGDTVFSVDIQRADGPAVHADVMLHVEVGTGNVAATITFAPPEPK